MPENQGQNISQDAWMAARRGETFRLLAGDQRLDSNDNLNEALQNFTEAINKAPHFMWAYAHRGLTYRQLGELEDAIQDFQKVITAETENNPWIYAQLGETYRLQMDGETNAEIENLGNKAIENFQKAIKQSAGEYAWAHAHLGATYCMLGNAFSKPEHWEKAEASLTKAIQQTQRRYAWAFAYKAVVYFKTKKFSEAVEELQQAYLLDPRVVANLDYQKGIIYKLNGQSEEALKTLNKALRTTPNNSSLLYGIAQCTVGQPSNKEADIAREALASDVLSAIEMLIALAIRERSDEQTKKYLSQKYKQAKELLNDIINSPILEKRRTENPLTSTRNLYFMARSESFDRAGLSSKNELISLIRNDLSWLGLNNDELEVFKD